MNTVPDAEEYARRLTAFLHERLPDADSIVVSDCARITGGYSCITTRFTASIDGETRLLLARADAPADQRVLEGSDRLSEWSLLSALTVDGTVPMPAALFCDADGSELGTKTIILEFERKGSLLSRVRSAAGDEALLEESDALADLIASVHSVDLRSLPSDFADIVDWNSYVDEMIDLWRKVEAEHCGTEPLFRYMAVWLDENRPPPAPSALVHGEFQVSNVVIGDDDELLAIDWEFAHIGDPREDLGWALWVGAIQPPNLVGLDLERFCQRYRDRTGLGEDIINPVSVTYFSILPSIKVFRSVLEQQRSVIDGTNTSVQTAYMGGAIAAAYEQWHAAAQGIQAIIRSHQEVQS